MDKEHVKGAADKVVGESKEVAGHVNGSNNKIEICWIYIKTVRVDRGELPHHRPASMWPAAYSLGNRVRAKRAVKAV